MDIINFISENFLYFISFLSGLILSWLKYKNSNKKLKLEVKKYNLDNKIYQDNLKKQKEKTLNKQYQIDFLTSIMNLSKMNKIVHCVDNIFKKTKADRFLVLVAINGKTDFNFVSVVFEQHNITEEIDAIATYKEIKIDRAYREMLKLLEYNDFINLNVNKMKDCLLKDFYELEGVYHSQLRFLARQKINDKNDFVVFSSLATHNENTFIKKENTIIKSSYDSVIIPTIKDLISN